MILKELTSVIGVCVLGLVAAVAMADDTTLNVFGDETSVNPTNSNMVVVEAPIMPAACDGFVYDSGDSPVLNSGRTVGPASTDRWEVYQPVIFANDVTVCGIDVDGWYVNGTPDTFEIGIYPDDGSGNPDLSNRLTFGKIKLGVPNIVNWMSTDVDPVCLSGDTQYFIGTQTEGDHWSAIYFDCPNGLASFSVRNGDFIGGKFGSTSTAMRLRGTQGCGGGGLYGNGGPNYSSGNEMTNWLQANDFTLRAKSTVEHVDFSVLDTNGGSNLANWDGTASWYIYKNASSAPGSLIASGAGKAAATFDQAVGGWDFWDFAMDLDAPQCLDAGTYWLGLHLNRSCDVRADLYWSTTDPNGTFGHHEDMNCDGDFSGPGNEHSFSLSGSDGCGSSDCLTMVVSTLISNAPADWVVCGATPDVEVAVVYGFRPGNTSINGFAGYCADFGIDGVNQKKVVCRKKADGSGCITCRVGSLPAQPGTRILTQAAMKGTCPDPCMSNLDDQIVQ